MNLHRLNLRQFRYFVGVVDAGSFSRAAASLHIAQPALSEQISNLEKELGVELLTRGPRGAQPTSAGSVFYRSARAVLGEIKHVRAALQTSGDLVGEVSLGLTTSFSATFAEPIVSAVLARHPQVLINIVDAPGHHHYNDLLCSKLDIAVLHEESEGVGIERRPLYDQRLFYVERRNSIAAGPGIVRVADLVDRPFLLPPMPNPSRIVLETAFMTLGAKPKVIAEANSRSTLMALVAGGIGGTLLAWSGIPDPAFEWSLIVDPSISHHVCLGRAHLLPRSEVVVAVQDIVEEVIMTAVRGPDWKGAVLPAAMNV
ncbi:LysR substrate-binding domain-containing protein [Hyphomicrobium sp. MC1]|uniref:LysR substrate-binding domain-containing protein n=1 Tax=Hyphomicrobium sp. (strain MC1) TaxID=717785 RepID=UPI000213EDAF|nr:LysR substrate-binding domain-containing protein [Hyphomicrobium sp. MC1]CCB66671.1 putative Nitrogen assimilation regulatory protein nac [Hyphomicrobium sp. MC1]